ncbi:hypothetical protein [Pseudoxanthomonas sp.]|jgi:hypothetical protein|uniref:helix-turn-helix transcriptional regulator n=1 Tax=Pseudoxanthomonas sp. TaxID=1871049 RepID=UPI002E15095B|nr:hypothetical protein [Pseudoxanthomonas sp.]
MVTDQPNETERLRHMADALDCLLEEDFRLLAGATQGTIEAWRKRGQGPSYIRLGNRVLYPRDAVAEHLKSLARERTTPRVTFL